MHSTRKPDFSRSKENSRDMLKCTNNENIARIPGNLPTTRGSAFSINMDRDPQCFNQSPIYENIEPDHTGVNHASSTEGPGETSNFQPERRLRAERIRVHDSTVNYDDEVVYIRPHTRDASGITTENGDTSDSQSERRPRVDRTKVQNQLHESTRIFPPTRDASQFTVGTVDISASQSERRSTAERLRTHYLMVNNGAEVPQILPQPSGHISELFSRVLENAVLNDSRSEIDSWNDRLKEHGSADNNDTGGNKKFSMLEITSRVLFVLTVIFSVICCVARFTEQKTTSSISVTLVSLFLAIGCFASYVLIGFFAICTIPFRNEPLDFNF